MKRWLARAIHLVFFCPKTHGGVWSAYRCCHDCAKPAERVCIPFYPCPCLYVRDELAALRARPGARPRIECVDLGRSWVVYFHLGPELGESSCSRETLEDAVAGAFGMLRAWDYAATRLGFA